MNHYGIELEFFVKNKKNSFVPAYKATSNLDGNPVIGEIRTAPHRSIVDAVFDLKRLLYKEELKLKEKGFKLILVDSIKVDDKFIEEVRSGNYGHKKDYTKKYSIYPGGLVGKILPVNEFKASLQLSFSSCITKYISTLKKVGNKLTDSSTPLEVPKLFNYIDPIYTLDNVFEQDILDSKRVKGVYAIKSGIYGERIEYRSLPNTIKLDKLLTINLEL